MCVHLNTLTVCVQAVSRLAQTAEVMTADREVNVRLFCHYRPEQRHGGSQIEPLAKPGVISVLCG